MRNGMSVEDGVGIGNMAVHTTPGWHDSNDVRILMKAKRLTT